MNQDNYDLPGWQAFVERAADGYPYPPTPDIAGAVLEGDPSPLAVRRWRLATLAVLVILLFFCALSVPPVRAAVLEFLELGAVRIFFEDPTQPGRLTEPATSPQGGLPGGDLSDPSLIRLRDLSGEMSLTQAQEMAGFPIRLPDYPPGLAEPQVYYQDLGGPTVILVWAEPSEVDSGLVSLMILGPQAFAGKGAPEFIEEAWVDGQRALWMQGPHELFLWIDGSPGVRAVNIDSNVLIWEQGGLTYRIETTSDLEEALRIAESLRPLE